MILSVSRRTDIPAYYSEWFFKRLREGFLYVRNPVNLRQVSQVALSREAVDCMVFWTKNPKPMLSRLDELSRYPCYFQFTLTGYDREIEMGLPDKKSVLIPAFQTLAQKLGDGKIVWRYDPIFISERYSVEYHVKAFSEIAAKLSGCTDQVIISFIDLYKKTVRNTAGLGIFEPDAEEIRILAEHFAETAWQNRMRITTCCEKIDLSEFGIEHGSCIDPLRIERVCGGVMAFHADRGGREYCGCVKSVDVGRYDTCPCGCRYCYACASGKAVAGRVSAYDVNSPILCDEIRKDDVITQRKK